MPALQTLLSRGTRYALCGDLSKILFEHFQLSGECADELPVAAISAYGDGLDSSLGWWLCVDPVHLVADRDQLYLSASDVIGLEREEADALVEELNRFYNEDGWYFYVASPQRWYLRLPEPLALKTISTAEAMGSRVGEVLPQGDDALYWQRLMTEMQMMLHASTVNAERNDRGLLTVNSLWFWGAGEMPPVSARPDWGRVVADDPLAKGLARLYRISTEEAVVGRSATRQAASSELWQTTLMSPEAGERELFVPLLNRLRAGELDELLIELPGIGRWRIERRALRCLWRRRRPLASLLQGEH